MLRFSSSHVGGPLLIASVVFFALHYGYESGRDMGLETIFIDRATVVPAAALLNQIVADELVLANAQSLVSTSTKLTILNGCEGTETLFLLLAAMAATPAVWSRRIIGMTGAVAVVFLLNQVRIVVLFIAQWQSLELFAVLHGYVAPTLIIFLACTYYLWWIQWASRPAIRG